MAKSLLSTEEILKLKDCGVSAIGIAELAGTSANAVHVRISPDHNRAANRQAYQGLSDEGKKVYSSKELARYYEAQKKSIAAMKESGFVKGRPWSEEEVQYLKVNGTTKTALEVAIHLKRTFAAVHTAARRYHVKLRE
ncbi:MAG: hypothetical protein G01um101419_595 [Parcubacteria group bacterium Gr01-1014_19]|nr:MAG: hypothetical protein G01um101419_595 [Parcubacteria group bacterium Gr01-1014_19]